jgi:hypothetical protein
MPLEYIYWEGKLQTFLDIIAVSSLGKATTLSRTKFEDKTPTSNAITV